jgi:hypothetical protein
MPENQVEHPLRGAAFIKHATSAAPKPHFIAELDFAHQYEDAHQCLRLLRNGSIEAELHDWSEVARFAHGNAVSYILTVPFDSLTDLYGAMGLLPEDDPKVTMAEPWLLPALRDAFPGYLALRDFLRARGVAHAIAFDSWAATPQARAGD